MINRFCGNERMHQVVSYNGILFLSGQTFPSGDTIEEQAEGVLNTIATRLAEPGSDKEHLLAA